MRLCYFQLATSMAPDLRFSVALRQCLPLIIAAAIDDAAKSRADAGFSASVFHRVATMSLRVPAVRLIDFTGKIIGTPGH